MGWEGSNRRKVHRVTYPCLIKISTVGTGSETVLTQTENLSVGGACVIMRQKLPVQTKLAMVLDLLDGEESLFCNGKVVWTEKRPDTSWQERSTFDTGIEFSDLSPQDFVHLQRVVSNLVEVWNKNMNKK